MHPRTALGSLQKRFAEDPGLPFSDVLPAEEIQETLTDLGTTFRKRIFDPITTTWAFLSQILSRDSSCRDIVARLLAHRAAHGQEPISARTGGYVRARQRLPLDLLIRLTRRIGQKLHETAEEGWLWKGRNVVLVDGSTLTMPDTLENQAEYPQTPSQEPGLGFPITRVCALFSLSSGSVLDFAMARFAGKQTGEKTLFRSMWNTLCPGDIVMGDRLHDNFWNLCMLARRGVDSVYRMHGNRKLKFNGEDDIILEIVKPQRPDWMTSGAYEELPDTIRVRCVRAKVRQPGSRAKTLVLVTTLLEGVSRDELIELYRQRWNVETDFCSLKQYLQMDPLRCRTPEMIEKEIWAHLLAYNLLRTVIAQAAIEHDLKPREISVKGAIQTVEAFAPFFQFADEDERFLLVERLLKAIASHRVADRPGRREPRCVKRRRASYPYLTKPRHIARTEMR